MNASQSHVLGEGPVDTMVAALAQPRSRRSRYTQGRCSRCGAYELHRSRAKSFGEKLVSLGTPLVPLRCPACGTRTLRLPSAVEPRREAPALQVLPRRQRASSRRRARRMRRMARFIAFYAAVLSLAAAMGYFASRS